MSVGKIYDVLRIRYIECFVSLLLNAKNVLQFMKDDMKLDFFFRNISIQNAIVVQVLCFLMLKVKEVSEGSKYDLQCDLQG